MAEHDALPDNPLYWPLEQLIAAYTRRSLSPVDVLELALDRIDALDPQLNAFLGRLDQLAMEQAKSAESSYRDGTAGPLCGVPLSIKDTFQIAGQETTFGSLVFRGDVSAVDCGSVRRLRAAGAVFTGRSNTAEFGQSATTENRFFPDARNPWDTSRTSGGSSGGAAASVAAGLSSIALGADGGGSIRIPAAFTGLFGMKPTMATCENEQGLAAMSEFVCPGPLCWCADDARRMLGVLGDRQLQRRPVRKNLRIAWCAHPEQRPTEPAIDAVLQAAVTGLKDTGERITEVQLPLEGWREVFAPLVLAEEKRERGHLLERADLLTDYERKTLQASLDITDADLRNARSAHERYRRDVQDLFEDHDFILTPATATTAFEIGQAPRSIDGRPVSRTWGAYPFTAPFNVSGNPAVSLPCGIANDLPVGLQIVGKMHADAELLDFAENVEAVVHFDRRNVLEKWSMPAIDRQCAI